MPLEVVEEQLESVRDETLTLLAATRDAAINASRFDWLYLRNPDGKAVIWSIRESQTGEMAGFTVALPRRMIVQGSEKLCWNCADFSIHPRYRTLGPALKLRRAARDGVDAGRVDFLYAHPNPRMAAIHERVGHTLLAPMVRMARVLRSAPYLQQKVPSKVLAAAVGGMVDPYLRWSAPERKYRRTGDVHIYDETHFDRRFSELFAENFASAKVCGFRDARYLQWRYAENPLEKSMTLVAERAGRLRGWLVFAIRDDVAFIQDLFPPKDANILRDLLSAILHEARARRLRSVSFTALLGNPVLPVLREFGFQERPETGRMFFHAPINDRSPLLDSSAWYVTVGDRDV